MNAESEFPIAIASTQQKPPGCHSPIVRGRFTSEGAVRINPDDLTILQYAFGWSYYLGYLLFGPLGYFLAPIFGGFTYHGVVHKIKWDDASVKFDRYSPEITVCGVESDSKKWHWVFTTKDKQALIQALRQHAKIPETLAQGTQMKCPKCEYVLDEPDWRCPECFYEFP